MPHQRAHFLIAKRRAVFVELLSRHSLGALGREMLIFFSPTQTVKRLSDVFCETDQLFFPQRRVRVEYQSSLKDLVGLPFRFRDIRPVPLYISQPF